MKKLIIILLVFLNLSANSQTKIGIINYDSLECCKTIRGNTFKNEIPNVPIIYTSQLSVDSISGYPNFNWSIVVSTDGKKWNTIKSGIKTISSIVWDNKHSWDTILIETTPFSTIYLGIEIETIDSTQVSRHKHDLIVTPYN
jgi:hypothetical protein